MALKSIQEAADTWGVSVHTARRLAAAGLVKTINVGRRRLVSESEIARITATGAQIPISYRNVKHVARGRNTRAKGAKE